MMFKKFSAATAVGMAMAGSLCAQSLYDLSPSEDEQDSLPLTWTAGINFGYDDNPTPLLGNSDDESFYGQAYVGAAFLVNTPQTTFNFGAQIGVIHYFDNLDQPGVDVDDTSFTAALYANFTRRVSERLRFVSRNRLSYELEPDYSTGFQSQRQVGNYFTYSTDNAIGYRWSERFATYTGVRFDGITYDDVDNADRNSVTIYNDFRYQASERTVLTLSYRYRDTSGDGGVSDSTNHFVLGGIEHRFSPSTVGVLRAGAQIRDVDNGNSSTSPYVEATLRTRTNEQVSYNFYARYGIEDYSRSIANGDGVSVYSDNTTLRLGFRADVAVSQALTLFGGVNYAGLMLDELQNTTDATPLSEVDEDLINAFIGFKLQLNENLFLNGTYNFEDYTSDADRDYDRNRFSLGVSATF